VTAIFETLGNRKRAKSNMASISKWYVPYQDRYWIS